MPPEISDIERADDIIVARMNSEANVEVGYTTPLICTACNFPFYDILSSYWISVFPTAF